MKPDMKVSGFFILHELEYHMKKMTLSNYIRSVVMDGPRHRPEIHAIGSCNFY